MAQEGMPHDLTLKGRKKLTMTGVTEVVSFDENTVIVHTDLGTLTVQGQQLQLSWTGEEVLRVDGSVSQTDVDTGHTRIFSAHLEF